MQPAGAILQNNFKNRFGVLLEPFGPESHHGAMGAGRFMQLEFGDFEQMLAIFIAARPVQQQVLDGVQAQAAQERRALGTNARESRDGPS